LSRSSQTGCSRTCSTEREPTGPPRPSRTSRRSATGPAKIAGKQHAELINTFGLIEVLPPGLYEMILEEKMTEDVGADLLPGDGGAAGGTG
jgi:hypothetical protein